MSSVTPRFSLQIDLLFRPSERSELGWYSVSGSRYGSPRLATASRDYLDGMVGGRRLSSGLLVQILIRTGHRKESFATLNLSTSPPLLVRCSPGWWNCSGTLLGICTPGLDSPYELPLPCRIGVLLIGTGPFEPSPRLPSNSILKSTCRPPRPSKLFPIPWLFRSGN